MHRAILHNAALVLVDGVLLPPALLVLCSVYRAGPLVQCVRRWWAESRVTSANGQRPRASFQHVRARVLLQLALLCADVLTAPLLLVTLLLAPHRLGYVLSWAP